MERKIYIVLSGLVIVATILSFSFNKADIPKVWDIEKIHSMHMPMPGSSVVMNPVSEEYYYKLPERVAYKSYPFYMPGKEPKGLLAFIRAL